MIDILNLRRGATVALAVAAIFGNYGQTRAAVIITTTNSPMTENFDAFAGSNATIPANFTRTPDGASGTLSNIDRGLFNPATQAYTNNNGLYALYFSATNDSSDRAYGLKRQPNATPDVLAWSFMNQTGADITDFNVSWDVEQYTFGNRATMIDLDYNPNGAGATQAGIVGTTLTAASVGGGSGANLASPTITSRSVSITLATPVANGQSIDFRWSTKSDQLGTGANAHIGIDNLSVTALVPEPCTILMGAWVCAISGLSRGVRRRGRRVFSAHGTGHTEEAFESYLTQ
jgi:hypothetical protein